MDKFEELINVLNDGIYEKSKEISLALLAMIAGESVILLGPPGVAKSMVARQMKNALANGRSFEYLMSRFSIPDEIFGPVSISKLKDADRYERITDGYMPSADVVFLDEIWKAGPAIQNTLLTILNEKIFRNGDTDVRVPLKLLIAASNELPANDEGLEALWDRFLIRIVCKNIEDEHTFYQMILDDDEPASVPTNLQITEKEYADWQRQIAEVKVPEEILHCITYIRSQMKTVHVAENVTRNVYVSDRRWKHIIRLMKAAAFINGNGKVGFGELGILCHCLWNETDEIEHIAEIVALSVYHEMKEKLTRLDSCLRRDVKDWEMMKAVRQYGGVRDVDWRLKLHDDFYYLVADHGTGRTYIMVTDYKRVMTQAQYREQKGIKTATDAVMYSDPDNPKRTIIQTFAFPGDESRLSQMPAKRVKLLRGVDTLYINGMEYHMDTLAPGEQQSYSDDVEFKARYNYMDEYARLVDDVHVRSCEVRESFFTDSEMSSKITDMKKRLFDEIEKSRSLIDRLAK